MYQKITCIHQIEKHVYQVEINVYCSLYLSFSDDKLLLSSWGNLLWFSGYLCHLFNLLLWVCIRCCIIIFSRTNEPINAKFGIKHLKVKNTSDFFSMIPTTHPKGNYFFGRKCKIDFSLLSCINQTNLIISNNGFRIHLPWMINIFS